MQGMKFIFFQQDYQVHKNEPSLCVIWLDGRTEFTRKGGRIND